MPTCKECKFYKPIDDSKGSCFGHGGARRPRDKSVPYTHFHSKVVPVHSKLCEKRKHLLSLRIRNVRIEVSDVKMRREARFNKSGLSLMGHHPTIAVSRNPPRATIP